MVRLKGVSMRSKQIVSQSGQKFTVNNEGRKVDQDGFMCSSISGGLRNPLWFCVSVKRTADVIQVRDTKDPAKTTLSFNKNEWEAFIRLVRK